MLNYSGLPEHIQKGVRLYIEQGIPTGDFLRAVIENNLRESFARADHINGPRLQEIVQWFHWEAPSLCWGSPQRRLDWMRRFAREQESHDQRD